MADQIKIPPQNIEAEQSVLGALLLDKEAIFKVADFLRADDFYREDHSTIYNAILELYEKRKPVDVITLTDILEKEKKLKDIGGASYLTTLANTVSTAANVTTYAQIIQQKATLRRLISTAGEIAELGYDETKEIETVLDKAESALFSVSQKYVKQYFTPIKDVLAESFERIDKLHRDKGTLRGVPSGFRDLDNLLAGFQNSDLIILAARPSIGKSSLALNFVDFAACEKKVPVGIFSLEMSKEQVIDRLLCLRGAVDSWKLRTGNLEDEDFGRLNYAMGALSEAPIFIDDAPIINVMEIRTKARRLQAEHGLGMVMVDYMQLVQGNNRSSDNRVQEVSEISRGLKGLARELDVPVVALSQLSRSVEHRDNKRPMLADLRESGCLAGDTLIYNGKTGQRIPIKNLAGQKSFNCLGVTCKNKLRSMPASKIFSTGRKTVYELTLSSGKAIKATANHRFLSLEGWVRLDRLKRGDTIATPRTLSWQAKNEMTDKKIILLAHLIGDGCYLARQPLHYTNADHQCLKAVSQAASISFGTKNRLIKQKNWYHLYLAAPEKLARGKRNPIVKWLDEELSIFNQRSGEKRIPQIIFELPPAKIALFIRHLFATDGGLTKSSGMWRLHYASKSKNLIYDLQHLLLRFSIHARIKINRKKNYAPVYNLTISGAENQKKFLKEIGIFGQKSINVKKALKELKNVKINTNIDTIPKEIWTKIIRICKDQGLTTRQFHQKMGWAYSGTQRYKNNLSRLRLLKIAEVLSSDELKDLAQSDIFWDKITEIRKLGREEVYDITVPVDHNFIANDIIVHNSIEQDADVVMFIYRDDYYDQETENKNIAEILIRKHRNGPTGDIKLYWKPEYMKFGTLERKVQSSEQ